MIVLFVIFLRRADATGTTEPATISGAATAAVTLSAFAVWLQSATKKDSAYAEELERKLGTEEVSSVEVRQCLCCCLYHFAHFT